MCLKDKLISLESYLAVHMNRIVTKFLAKLLNLSLAIVERYKTQIPTDMLQELR